MYHQLMMENQSIFTKKVFEHLSDRDLSLGQPKILEYLNVHDGAVQKDIALACRIEPATVTSILSRMEKNGLIERRMHDNNRRYLYVFLTEKGRTEVTYVEKAFVTLEGIALDSFTDKEKDQFIEYLKRVNNNLKRV
jgi:DNA-binding MarR family transcriptional regulator